MYRFDDNCADRRHVGYRRLLQPLEGLQPILRPRTKAVASAPAQESTSESSILGLTMMGCRIFMVDSLLYGEASPMPVL